MYRQGRFGALLNFKNEQPLFDHENVFSVVVLLVGQPASHHCGAWAIYNSHSGQGIPFAYDTGLTTHILCTPVVLSTIVPPEFAVSTGTKRHCGE